MICPRSLVVFFVLALGAPVAAQEITCNAKLADLPNAPELSAFRLGMTPEQVKARVPQVQFGPTNEFGVSKTSINPDFDPRIDKTNFRDVRTVSLDFLDGRVTSLWIGFEGTFKWKTADEFVSGISQALALPGQWITKGRSQQLTCADFQVTVNMIAGGPSLRIIDMAAEQTVAVRRQQKEDEAEAAESAPEPSPVIGDTRKKLYYQEDCDALKSVPEKSRMTFASEKEAEKAGYKRSASCQ